MANPQVHARSSALKFGKRWEDYIEVHAFLDHSKLHYAKATHRALLHHEFGKKLAVKIFGTGFGVNRQLSVAQLVDQHFSEDFTRFVPTVTKWFEGSDSSLRPQMLRKLTVEEQCAESVRHFGGKPEDYRELHEFIDSITTEIEGAWGITHSTFGLWLVEECFGYILETRDVPTRTAAEKHILAEYGAIPSAQDWLSAISIQPWMYNQASQLSVELQKCLGLESTGA